MPHLIVDAWPGEGHIGGKGGGVIAGPQGVCPWGWGRRESCPWGWYLTTKFMMA